jgi:hypothetical protein
VQLKKIEIMYGLYLLKHKGSSEKKETFEDYVKSFLKDSAENGETSSR